MLPFEPGDVISFRSPAGGGWGNPKMRDTASVLADVRSGLLSIDAARERYGVALRRAGGRLSVDEAATAKARAVMSNAAPIYGFGPQREAYEREWTPQASDALAIGLRQLPVAEHPAAKHAAHAALKRNRAVTFEDVEAWLDRRLNGEAGLPAADDEFAALYEKVAVDQPVSNDELVGALKGAIKARSKVTYLIWKELQRECPDIDATALIGRVYRAWGAECGEAWEGVHDAASALLAQTSKGGYLTFQQRFVCAGEARAQKDFGFCPHMEALDELGATAEDKRAFCQDILSEGDYGNLDPHPGLTLTFEHQIGAGDDHCSYVITAQ